MDAAAHEDDGGPNSEEDIEKGRAEDMGTGEGVKLSSRLETSFPLYVKSSAS